MSCNVWLQLAWKAHRQTTRQEILPDSGFDDDRRPTMYGSESLGRRLVKQLVSLRDAPS